MLCGHPAFAVDAEAPVRAMPESNVSSAPKLAKSKAIRPPVPSEAQPPSGKPRKTEASDVISTTLITGLLRVYLHFLLSFFQTLLLACMHARPSTRSS